MYACMHVCMYKAFADRYSLDARAAQGALELRDKMRRELKQQDITLCYII